MLGAEDLIIWWTDPSDCVSRFRCRSRYPDRPSPDVLTYPQAVRDYIRKVRARSRVYRVADSDMHLIVDFGPSTAATLQRLTVFAVNTGIWPALFALFDAHLGALVHFVCKHFF